VILYLSAMKSGEILHAAPRGLERVMNHEPQIMMRLQFLYFSGYRSPGLSGPAARSGLALNDNFLAGHHQVNANVTLFPLPVVAVRNLNGDTAAQDAVIECFEFFRLLQDPFFDLWRRLHIAKCDLYGKFHGPLPWLAISPTAPFALNLIVHQ
jgi:hypothetical protein